ncbi:M56 family metallopeptidase [Saprospira sp. CCB-QB6]|uniref:M56 family metallopeptidase n=1 Tax=Saprospira sp. CCB-QB6 TaxID=3023936 RepID=UPI00234B6EEA|nr:M56 family metallopeptidase [Saprospira sp. CCB-QB6]WCL82001.1 M56 family metallopeptidase [Saprospira sp. CCB-QB6]
MLIFLLLSALLLAAGALFYWALRKRLSWQNRKLFIWTFLLAALLLPSLMPSLEHYFEKTWIDYESYEGWNQVDIEDPKLLSCYKSANNSEGVCHCEIKQKAALVDFQPDPYYDTLMDVRWALESVFLLLATYFLLRFLWRFGGLIWLRLQSYAEPRELENQSYQMLYPKGYKSYPFSTFSLLRHYILWSPALDCLNEEEQQAAFYHELGHLKGRDSWAGYFLGLLQIFWFWHPLYYVFRKELLEINELLADDYAAQRLASRRSYAEMLLKMTAFQHKGQALAFFLAKKKLQKRLEVLLFQAAPKGCTKKQFQLLQICLLSGLFLLSVGLYFPLHRQFDAQPTTKKEQFFLPKNTENG